MEDFKVNRTVYYIFLHQRSPVYRLHNFLHKHRLLIFLISLLVLLMAFSVSGERSLTGLITLELLFSVTMIIGIYIVSYNKQLLTISSLIALLTLSIVWFNLLLGDDTLLTISIVLEIIFFLITTVTILSYVLQFKRVTADKIHGSICGYLLIGIVWALVYALIEHLYPGSFKFAEGFVSSHAQSVTHPAFITHFNYFSYVTLTTLGYGDVVPVTDMTRSLAAVEAVSGQLYIAVLIARLVGLHISHQHLTQKDLDSE